MKTFNSCKSIFESYKFVSRISPNISTITHHKWHSITALSNEICPKYKPTLNRAFHYSYDNNYTNWKLATTAITIAAAISYLEKQNNQITKNDTLKAINDKEVDEIELGDVSRFEEGVLHQIKIAGGKDSILLIHLGGQFYCTGNSCAHYGAPLHKGALGAGYVTCGLHGAQFDLKTGKAIQGPVTDGLPCFETTVKDGKVYAFLPKTLPLKVTPTFASRDPEDKRVYAIIGSGPAGFSAAETLRQEGYKGEIVMITTESHPPYERPVLSKNMKVKMEDIYIRDEEFLENTVQINLMKNCNVERVDPSSHTIRFSSGKTMKYDKVLIATGSTPRRMDITGSNLNNIFVLRDPEDNASIKNFAKQGAKIAIIGSSFIGMEVASALSKAGAKVTVISTNSTPFESTLGKRVGDALKGLFKANGVEFFFNTTVKSFKGKSNRVNGVELSNGDIVQADAVIYGIGVSPNTSILNGVPKLSDGSLEVDPFMKIKQIQDVFVAGDIVSFPYFKSGKLIRSEHWNSAIQQGKIAAKNMVGSYIPYSEIPFFWSMMYGKSIRYTGYGEGFDKVIFEGDVENFKFIAYYAKDQKIVAVASMGMEAFSSIAQEAIRYNLMPTVSELELNLANSKSIIERVKANSVKISKVKPSQA